MIKGHFTSLFSFLKDIKTKKLSLLHGNKKSLYFKSKIIIDTLLAIKA